MLPLLRMLELKNLSMTLRALHGPHGLHPPAEVPWQVWTRPDLP